MLKVCIGKKTVPPATPGGRPKSTAVYRSFTFFGTRREAERRLTELLGARDDRTLLPRSRQTVAEFLAEWREAGCPTGRRELPGDRTRRDYAEMHRLYVDPILGDFQLEALTPARIQRWIDKLATSLGPRTVGKAFANLRAPLNKARQWKRIVLDPCDGVALPRARRRPQTPLGGPNEAGRFLRVAEADDQAAYWSLLLGTGLRPGEAAALTWGDVEDGIVRVRRALSWAKVKGASTEWSVHPPKTPKSQRAIPLPGFAVRALERHRKRQAADRLRAGSAYASEDFVFADELGRPLKPMRLHKRFKRLLRDAGLPSAIRVYDLRHSCATLLLAAGEHPKVVSERLGHASVAMTLDTYSAVLPTMQAAATAKLEGLLGGVRSA